MDALVSVLSSEAFLTIIAAIVTALWGIPRVRGLVKGVEAGRGAKLFDLARRAVVHTFQVYVQERKRASADGKLKSEEIREARKIALAKLKVLIANEAPSLMSHYADSYLPYVIELALRAIKK
jgi:hypothetical protein